MERAEETRERFCFGALKRWNLGLLDILEEEWLCRQWSFRRTLSGKITVSLLDLAHGMDRKTRDTASRSLRR